MEALSLKYCCRGKAMSITYSERVYVALGIQNAMLIRRIVICGLPRSTIFFSTLSPKRHDFRKKDLPEHKMCFDFLYNFRPKHFPS
jgi:hypothetical protein